MCPDDRNRNKKKFVLVIMGVSGCGKSTIGRALANKLGWSFIDGDSYHPQENVDKMTSGIPLIDEDRTPWLENLNKLINDQLRNDKSLLLACSALKDQYRQILKGGNPDVSFVYLKGNFELINARLQSRPGHYMKPKMLQSQFDDLEEPQDALVIDVVKSVPQIVDEISKKLKLQGEP